MENQFVGLTRRIAISHHSHCLSKNRCLKATLRHGARESKAERKRENLKSDQHCLRAIASAYTGQPPTSRPSTPQPVIQQPTLAKNAPHIAHYSAACVCRFGVPCTHTDVHTEYSCTYEPASALVHTFWSSPFSQVVAAVVVAIACRNRNALLSQLPSRTDIIDILYIRTRTRTRFSITHRRAASQYPTTSSTFWITSAKQIT